MATVKTFAVYCERSIHLSTVFFEDSDRLGLRAGEQVGLTAL